MTLFLDLARSLRSLLLLPPLVAALAGCGARSDLLDEAGSSGGGTGAPLCPAWSATSAPVQISSIPSIMEAQTVLATPSGVLVAYADSQFPPVDPTWHARLVGYGDGSLGAEETVFQHDTSALDWTRLFFAQGPAGTAATASDQAQGMLFVQTDDDGAPLGSPVHVASDQGHYLSATSTGYSLLESPWDASGGLVPPVSLTTLDDAGAIASTVVLLDAATPLVDFERQPLADGDFMLLWDDESACGECDATRGQRFSESGAPLAPVALLLPLGPSESGQWVAATTSDRLMMVWTGGEGGTTELMAQPFDENGSPVGPAQTFAQPGTQEGEISLAIAAAPGGDFVVAWITGSNFTEGTLAVQAVGPDGKAEGPATTLGTISPGPEETLLVAASSEGAMVVYEGDVGNFGIEVFAVPLTCGG